MVPDRRRHRKTAADQRMRSEEGSRSSKMYRRPCTEATLDTGRFQREEVSPLHTGPQCCEARNDGQPPWGIVSFKKRSERWPCGGRVKSKVDAGKVISRLTLLPTISTPLGCHWSPDSPGTATTDWNLLDSHTRKTIKTPALCSLQLLFNTGVSATYFQNGLHSLLTVLLPLLPFCLNNGYPQILWILRKKIWISCCQFAFFSSSFKFTLNWIFWQICNSSFQIRLK